MQNSTPDRAVDMEVDAFEDCWRTNCLAGFIVARQAAREMLPLGYGSILLVGSTSALLGRENHLSLAVGKFGLRATAQVMARELWKQGIHVAHVVIDADIREPGNESNLAQSDPVDIADVIYSVHRQPRSAWTSEVDIRPFNEKFWEHC
jgi:NAD(P)-dependent dehydrogenase (short-subunit alcohol dehydrogenase family)